MTEAYLYTIANDGAGQKPQTRLQIFDLKQMADMEADYKIRARKALTAYKTWQKLYARQTDMIAKLYGGMEGQMLRRQAVDACSFYWIMRRDLRRSLNEYLRSTDL